MAACHNSLGWKTWVNVTILKVLEPNRFIIKETPSLHMSDHGQAFLKLEVKLMEHMAKRDIQPLYRGPPELGADVIVRKGKRTEWLRGKVRCILETLDGYKIEVYLVDYGETLYVEQRMISQTLRAAPPHVFDVPAQAVEFFLPYLRPVTLTLDEMAFATYSPSTAWDTAAMSHVKSLVAGAGAAEVYVQGETKAGQMYGILFIRCTASTACVNHVLVEKMFAVLDKTLQVEDDDESEDLPATSSTSSLSLVSEQQKLWHEQKRHAQEEAMREYMEKCLYGDGATTPFFRVSPLDTPKKKTPDSAKSGTLSPVHRSPAEVHSPLSSAPPPTGKRAPAPSLSSEELPFFDIETTSVASTSPVVPHSGRGRAPLLLFQRRNAGDVGAVNQAGEERTALRAYGRSHILSALSPLSVPGSSRAGIAGQCVHSVGFSHSPNSTEGDNARAAASNYGGMTHGAGAPSEHRESGQFDDATDAVQNRCTSSPGSTQGSLSSLAAKLLSVLTPSRDSATSSDGQLQPSTLDQRRSAQENSPSHTMELKSVEGTKQSEMDVEATSGVVPGKDQPSPAAQVVSPVEVGGVQKTKARVTETLKLSRAEKLKLLFKKGAGEPPLRTTFSYSKTPVRTPCTPASMHSVEQSSGGATSQGPEVSTTLSPLDGETKQDELYKDITKGFAGDDDADDNDKEQTEWDIEFPPEDEHQ